MSEVIKKKKTVGAHALELMQKAPESVDPVEIEREMQSEYLKNLIETVEDGRKKCTTDFFITVITKKEPLMQNVLRNYFAWRHSCPTPDYDQAVYHYRKNDEEIAFLWVIPAKDICHMFKENALQVAPEERALRDFVLSFADGSLYKLAKQLNGEVSIASSMTVQ